MNGLFKVTTWRPLGLKSTRRTMNRFVIGHSTHEATKLYKKFETDVVGKGNMLPALEHDESREEMGEFTRLASSLLTRRC